MEIDCKIGKLKGIQLPDEALKGLTPITPCDGCQHERHQKEKADFEFIEVGGLSDQFVENHQVSIINGQVTCYCGCYTSFTRKK